MLKYEVLIKAVVVQGLSYGHVARQYGVSKALVHQLHHRWLAEGGAAYEPRSPRPATSPNSTPATAVEAILALRTDLSAQGLDAGAETLTELLSRQGVLVSRSSVWRTLKRADLITPQPQKRPRSSWQRFAADQPNQMSQSDFTHTTGKGIETIGWLDDHSRYLLHLSAHPRITGTIVTTTFTTTATTHGYPSSTLTDNGMVYTTAHARGVGAGNAFETLLALHGITRRTVADPASISDRADSADNARRGGRSVLEGSPEVASHPHVTPPRSRSLWPLR